MFKKFLTMTKLCKKCNQTKNISLFDKDLRVKSGLSAVCKDCRRERGRIFMREAYKRNTNYAGLESNRKYYKTNKNSINEWRRKWNKKCRLEVLSHYSSGDVKCACCGERTYEFLALDHINNDGAKDRKINKLGKGGFAMYLNIKKRNYPSGYQVLCHNCNLAKGFYGKCPHNN